MISRRLEISLRSSLHLSCKRRLNLQGISKDNEDLQPQYIRKIKISTPI